METPSSIQFKNDSKSENKVFASFLTNDIPEYIRVKGTDDFVKVKKNQKEWYSKRKYPDLALTLQFFKGNDVVLEPSYAADGKYVPPVVENNCEIEGFESKILTNNNAIVDWLSISESNIEKYMIISQENSESDFNIVDTNVLPKGNNQIYNINDDSTFDKTNAIYYLYVRFKDGKTLLKAVTQASA